MADRQIKRYFWTIAVLEAVVLTLQFIDAHRGTASVFFSGFSHGAGCLALVLTWVRFRHTWNRPTLPPPPRYDE